MGMIYVCNVVLPLQLLDRTINWQNIEIAQKTKFATVAIASPDPSHFFGTVTVAPGSPCTLVHAAAPWAWGRGHHGFLL
jgi:hypothetical protein